MTRVVKLAPMTAEAFAGFGDVVDPPAIGDRVSLSSTLTAIERASTPRLSFSHAEPHGLPLIATEMERHNRSSQCFVPLDVARWVVLVAPDRDGAPDPTMIRAFLVRGDQAVNYHVGTWHHPLRVLDRAGRFAVLMWTTGRKADDEEWATLREPLQLDT